jgi:membrane protein YqaA with SNARE-associated domain
MAAVAVYVGLFLTSFAAATLLPIPSELPLGGLLLESGYPPALLIAVASIGNTAGAVVNWALGRGIERFRDRRWFPVRAATLVRAEAWYRRYGRWSLLLSWLPVVGDPLTLVAGVLGERLVPFILLVGIAKTARYLVVAGLLLGWL